MTFPRVLLVIIAVVFVIYGLAYIIAPNLIAGIATGTAFASAAAVTDARAIYGGMALGIAAFAWFTSRGDQAAVRLGLSGSLLTFACIAIARIVGIVFDRSGGVVMYAILGSEILGVALCAWALQALSASEAPTVSRRQQ
jgi:hypothetical protein